MGRTVKEMIEAALRQSKSIGPAVGCLQAFVVTREEHLRLQDNATINWSWNVDRSRFCGLQVAVLAQPNVIECSDAPRFNIPGAP